MESVTAPAGVSRRTFLLGTATVAGSAMLAACGGGGDGSSSEDSAVVEGQGSATRPLAAPKKLAESPLLAEQVKSGSLPPLAERLPETPYVVPHKWVRPGNYGGVLNMNVYSNQGAAKADSDREFCYGHSPLRWLNDGKTLGPGIAEKWESNDDTSEWTLHFRNGLKWSDGHPWSTADILFWWEDMVLPGNMAMTPPDECRSGKGTLVTMTAVDDLTLKLTYDAPAPLTADRLACTVKGNIYWAAWTLPRHYLEQFHPKYNPDVPDDWDTVGGLFQQKADWHRNPECPTMTGWRCKSFDNNKGVVLERNPYYYVVSKNGDQLPYIDEVNISVVQDAEAGKLQVQQGQVDYCQGSFNQVTLNDVKSLRESSESAATEVLLWDSGSGTGSIFFFNYDYPDDDLRELIREPRFRQAISHAFNREALRQGVYFKTGELTTGTMSPKAVEYQVNDKGRGVYQDWRDSYVDYDPTKAKQLLDEIGVKDVNGDGVRELPNGKKLELRLDYVADQSDEHQTKDEQLVSDLEKVGIKMIMNPIAAQTFGDQWKAGKLMSQGAWEASDGMNHLVFPAWLIPIESQRWAPLEGQFYAVRGTKLEHEEQNVDPWSRTPPRLEPESGGPIEQMWKLYDESKVEQDPMRRTEIAWELCKLHIEHGPFFMGCVADYPQVMVIKKDLLNVPRQENLALGGYVNTWIHPTPAVYDPECYFWDDPDAHS